MKIGEVYRTPWGLCHLSLGRDSELGLPTIPCISLLCISRCMVFSYDIYIHLPPTLGVESPIITWSPGHHITLHLRSSLFGTIVIENDETNLVQSTSACGLRWTEDLDLVLLGGSILGAVLLRCLQHIHWCWKHPGRETRISTNHTNYMIFCPEMLTGTHSCRNLFQRIPTRSQIGGSLAAEAGTVGMRKQLSISCITWGRCSFFFRPLWWYFGSQHFGRPFSETGDLLRWNRHGFDSQRRERKIEGILEARGNLEMCSRQMIESGAWATGRYADVEVQ